MSKFYVDFLQDYPLYRKHEVEDSNIFDEFKNTAIYVYCKECGSEQSFVHYDTLHGAKVRDFLSSPAPPITGGKAMIAMPNPVSFKSKLKNVDEFVIHLDFICKGCGKSHRYFSIKIIDDFSLIKIGQYPPYDISVPSNISKALDEKNTELFKKGIICESQGYGIAAYAYYRRIVELIIDDLLNDISELIENSDNKQKYEETLEKTKRTTVTQEKIELVKDLLPSSLRPGGLNPLGILHSTLSEGLHSLSDETCIDVAEEIKTSLVYLVSEVLRHQQESKIFSASMGKILDKKSKRKKEGDQ